MRLSVLVALTLCLINGARAETEADVREKTLRALSKVESYAAVKLSAMVASELKRGDVELEFRNGQYFLRDSQLAAKSDAELVTAKEVRNRVQLASGCDLPRLAAFDGRKHVEFDPYGFYLRLQASPEFICGQPVVYLLPRNWICMHNMPAASFEFVLTEMPESNLVAKPNRDGDWEFTKTFDGDRFAFKTIMIRVSPSSGYLVTHYRAQSDKGIGTLVGDLTWAVSNGNWYPQQGTIVTEGDTVTRESTWTITSIDFDAKQIRSRFSIDEKELPVGVQKLVFNREGIDRSATSYVGGAAGEREFRLRQLAIQKARNP